MTSDNQQRDLSSWSPATRRALLTLGVFVFFFMCSYVEEFTFNSLPKFEYGWYLTFFELVCFATFAIIQRLIRGEGQELFAHAAPLRAHATVAVYMTLSRGLTNWSLQFLNYPTQVIFKSMKILTVMTGSVLLYKGSYTGGEYLSAALLALSACLFGLGDAKVAPKYSTFGITVVLLSLIADSLHANTQERLLKMCGVLETLLFTNIFSACYALVIIILNQELPRALKYCWEVPVSYFLFIIRAIVVYGGVLCYTTLTRVESVMFSTAVTTVRKIMTVMLSFLLFPKKFSSMYALGLIAFTVSLLLAAYIKNNEESRSRDRDKPASADDSKGGVDDDDDHSVRLHIQQASSASSSSSSSSISGSHGNNIISNGVQHENELSENENPILSPSAPHHRTSVLAHH